LPLLFLVAYTCSGFAGLVYQVCWTRTLTLYVGHSTAAASAVVSAFLGGLACGAAIGGALASRWSRRGALAGYALLEVGVACAALLIPSALLALVPVLQRAYADGAPGLLFPLVRIAAAFLLVFGPAAALGATFPLAIRWFASAARDRAQATSALYALNTTGAAAGALLAGFVMIPQWGLARTTHAGVAASLLAAAIVGAIARRAGDEETTAAHAPDRAAANRETPRGRTRKQRRAAPVSGTRPASASAPRWLILTVLGLSGLAALVHEIAWTRVLTLVLGPTIYAFSATLAVVIGGVALGSALGTWVVGWTRHPAAWLATTLALAAATASWTSSLAGGAVPRLVAQQIASANPAFTQLLLQGVLLAALLIVPTAVCFGAAFPLALALADEPSGSAARRFGIVYAVNTLGAVLGALLAGFLLIPGIGLQGTLTVVAGCVVAAAILVAVFGRLERRTRVAAGAIATIAVAAAAISPPWDRELLASGMYMYAPFVPRSLDVETMLKAGTLLYYREGAASTVSVKRLTGTTTLAVDGKTDASNRGDMLTQKLVAHLPLLLHPQPRRVAIVGLGSGVTAGAALTHPIEAADVVEISPEVVEASRFFETENRRALADPRLRLIVGDGRTHLSLTQSSYDVIVSEPSNPWIAGVASLFTREFFTAAKERLAADGVLCQWTNAYNISGDDLRAIVSTFVSVFPDATAWLVGEDDVLLVGTRDGTAAARLPSIAGNWLRPGVADDLRQLGAIEPFELLSLYVAGPEELAAFAGEAPIVYDDDLRLEFTAPYELHNQNAGQNGAMLAALLGEDEGPETVRAAYAGASAAQWRNRGTMMRRRDAHAPAYDDYIRALRLDASDTAALDGLVSTALLLKRAPDALSWVKTIGGERPSPAFLVARSKLLAATGAAAEALTAAREAAAIRPVQPAALEQVASLHADAGDRAQLERALEELTAWSADAAPTQYYAAAAAFLAGDAAAAAQRAERAIAADPAYAAVYDLAGAAYSRLGLADRARAAFKRSLEFDAHDSTAYANLGVLELEAGNRAAARNYFAEALWLDPQNGTAREGLLQTR
jgi:spermidine synthase